MHFKSLIIHLRMNLENMSHPMTLCLYNLFKQERKKQQINDVNGTQNKQRKIYEII